MTSLVETQHQESEQQISSAKKLSKTSILMHWSVGSLMIGIMAIGFFMTWNERYDLYSLHKSLGVLILPLALARIAWRMKKGFPEPVAPMDNLKVIAAKVVHYLLLASTVILPVSGMVGSAAGGYGVPFFGMSLIDAVPQDMRPVNETLASFAHTTHYIAGYVLAGVLILHVSGALWHHVIMKDRTLKRMLGR